ncbi:MAG: hypothetical protein RIS47_1870 [Bacteroidota bacterium]|jgi:hypothetical protein
MRNLETLLYYRLENTECGENGQKLYTKKKYAIGYKIVFDDALCVDLSVIKPQKLASLQ